MARNDKTVKRGVYLYIDGKEIKNDINSIDLEIKRLQRDIKDMTRGSEEYNRTMAKIQHLQGILKQHRQEIKGITTETKKATVSIGRMVDWFNRFGGVILSVIGFLTGFALALRSIRDERNKLEESQAGLKALTGLDDESITWLTAQAKTLSTTMTKEGLRVRQSASEILDAFMLVGSAKPELLGDKEALKQVTEEAMRLQAAAKDITLNEAVDSLTLALNQYGAAADQAGRFTNVLAAGSQAGSANVASQAKAIRTAGTAAASANIPIEQTVGLIETLAYRGIKDEVAGTGLKKFFLVLQTGADETNPKLVGLDKALENLKNKNMDAGAIKKMFGEEGFNTASVILQNTEMVNDFTKAVTGTNVAYEQAAINSDTAAAKLAQARNSMRQAASELGERLNPALSVSTNMLTNVVKFLPGLIDWFQKWGTTVVWLSIIIATYALRTKAVTIATTAWNAVTKIGTAIQLAYGIAMNTVSGYTITSLTQMRKLSVMMAGHNVLMKVLRTTTFLYAASVHLLHGRIDLATKAMKGAWAVMKLNPAGLLVTVIVATASALLLFNKRVDSATKAQRLLNEVQNEALAKSQTDITQTRILYKMATDVTKSLDERRYAIKKLNEISPEYLGNLSLENIGTDKARQAVDKYVASLITLAEIESAKSRLTNIDTQLADLKDKQAEYMTERNSFVGALKSLPRNLGNMLTFGAVDSQKESIDKSIKDLEEQRKGLVRLMEQKVEAQITNAANNDTDDNNNDNNDDDKKKNKFAKVEEAYYKRISQIKKQYLADDKMTQDDYNREMQDAELGLLNDKLTVAGLETEERQQINDKILDMQIRMRDELHKIEEQKLKDKETSTTKAAEEAEKKQKKESEAAFSRLDKEYQLQVEAATMHHYKNKTSDEEYYNELRRLQNNYYATVLADTTVSEEKKNDIRKQLREAQLNDAEIAYNKEIEQFNRVKDALQDGAKQLGESMAEFFTNEEQDFGDFMKNVLIILLDTLEKQLIATQAAAIAKVTISDISTKGWLGLASAAGKISLITAAFETAKGLLGNFYTGGYTGPGEWDQPKGYVHSNEFVANRFAVSNPNLRPIFDVIDAAQRSGNVGNLSIDDVVSVSGSRSSSSSVPVVASNTSTVPTTSDPALVAMINECSRTLRNLKERLDKDFNAKVYVTGKGGINDAMDYYDQLKNNISRKP